MHRPAPHYATLHDWIAREAIAFDVDSADSTDSAVDRMVGTLGDSVDLLGFGEAMHGSRELLALRNRIFERLVDVHGYSAIAIESSFPRGRVANDYVLGRGEATSYEQIKDVAFSHGFGAPDENRELIEWMRRYNAEASHRVKLHFYGFDAPTEMMYADSPRRLLEFVLDYLGAVDGAAKHDERRERIDALLGDDAAWENSAAAFDHTKSIGLSAAATSLRAETLILADDLRLRRAELIAKSDASTYLEVAQHATIARLMLSYHAGMAGNAPTRIADLLGLRDLMMAENLAYAVKREHVRGGGKVFAFAHDIHLQLGKAKWQLGPQVLEWSPAGANVSQMLGPRYAVIGSGVGVSQSNGIALSEPGTLEAHLTSAAGPARFIPTHRGEGLPMSEIAALSKRSGSAMNSTYFPLSSESVTDFDCLAVLD